jgi:hypothetical protein
MPAKSSNREETIHLLKQLTLPDRFENLYDRVGAEVARLLVAPHRDTVRALETAAISVNARNEGLLIPLYGRSGVGKTTLARNLTTFFPSTFTPTVNYEGKVTYDELASALRDARKSHPANEVRIIPLNLDHRESDPPKPAELAAMKRFLRRPSPGARCVLLWPETARDRADAISSSYVEIAGDPPIPLPLIVEGPDTQVWPQIAIQTLELANKVPSIVELGIDPRTYDCAEFLSMGAFLRRLSNDFSARLSDLINQTRKPLTLVVVFVSESQDAGVLAQLTNPGRFGLLEPSALLDATRESVIGKWWRNHAGLLTQTILQLNAHAYSLPPAPSVTVLRQFGPQEVIGALKGKGIVSRGAANVSTVLERSDIGRYFRGESRSAYESRGKPPETSTKGFRVLAEKGFTLAKDKRLNDAMAEAWREFCKRNSVACDRVTSEEKLDFCPLIPDNAVHQKDHVFCIEYTWRSGDFLVAKNRATTAVYILTKLQNYARELGWIAE